MDLLPRVEAVWKMGKNQPTISTLGYTKRRNAFITLFWPSKRIVWNIFKRRRNVEFRKHLSNIIAHAKRYKLRKIILFIDHASYHETDEVKHFLKEHKKVLHIKFLGKKDPNSNPVECLVNKRLNSAVAVNRSHASIEVLEKSMRWFLGNYNSIYAT